MEDNEKRNQDIVFSRAVKAGKRIYYIDVKQSKAGDMYIALTESKKVVSGDVDAPTVNFEKHKIFLYREDFEKVLGGLQEAIGYVEESQGKAEPRPERDNEEIKIDLEF